MESQLVVLSAILKLIVDKKQVESLLTQLPEEAKPLPDDKYHVTLMHQYFAAALREQLKVTPKEDYTLCWQAHPDAQNEYGDPEAILGERIYRIDRPAQKRSSWIVLCKNQRELGRYVNRVCYKYGLPPNPEPYRVYHVSLANLSGNPFHSVGDVDVSDLA